MYKRFNELSFVIGLFFILVSLILILNGLVNDEAKSTITFYSAGAFLIFGIFMLMVKSRPD
ncbi:MAG: hypothetical protein EOO04_12715 [Chitinophagaceae bacterium]|nr:MAG: hypothetical protein EOO04_12715 [Chitinophagaceae bacterium]